MRVPALMFCTALALAGGPAAARGEGPYTMRDDAINRGVFRKPEIGEETALGRFAAEEMRMAVACFRDADAFQRGHLAQRDPGSSFLAAFGTPITVLRFEGVTLALSGKTHKYEAAVVRLRGGPHRGEEVLVATHDILRPMTKDEVEFERREGRLLIGPLASRTTAWEVGETLVLARLALKSPERGPGNTAPTYRIFASPIPAFASMEAYRADFNQPGAADAEDAAPKAAPARSKTRKQAARGARLKPGQTLMPAMTRVRLEKTVDGDGGVPKAALVSLLEGPDQGRTVVVQADHANHPNRTLPYFPPDAPEATMPPYSPEVDARRPRPKRSPGKAAQSKAADPKGEYPE